VLDPAFFTPLSRIEMRLLAPRLSRSLALLALMLCSLPAGAADEAKSTFVGDIAPILATYCTGCHGGAKPKGGLKLDAIKTDTEAAGNIKIWHKVLETLRAGEMPPAGKKKPSADEYERIVRWIEDDMLKVDCTKGRDPGMIGVRRLNRAEYRNTIRDLLGVDYHAADDFPSDDVGYGFDNIGEVLTLSPLLVEKYLAAAEKIAELAFQNPATKARLLPRLPGPKEDKQEAARDILRPFVRLAYRRPPSPDEVDRLAKFVALAEKNGESFERGMQLAVQATLASPHFVFRVERTQRAKGGQTVFAISDYELASRLSYFLWSSMPDAPLFALAENKTLRGNLERQVRRMLQDPKARALTDNFAGQWLQLRSVESVTPDKAHYPAFDESLRRAMVRETQLFFETIVREDRILDFLDADYTFVDARLAKHYGMKDIKGPEFRKVSLVGTPRRGVLTQASILTVTSNPSRTSPVKRGKWILENVLNAPPPPPPPDVPELEETGTELKGSLRQRMEQHRVNPLCASCHQRMDPLGFGFENFDGIGGWREREGKFAIDASGTLPGGQSFKGPLELVAILKGREAEFRRCLAEKMLTYALGRGVELHDRCALDDIGTAVVRGGNRFSSLILAVVESEPFQKRKGRP
jgi:hypothetical protein